MAKLYVANCTKQRHEFLYIVPEDPRYNFKKTLIPIGGQALIYKEDTLQILTAIVEQHQRYGIVAAKDIPKTRAFIGICYSFNQPVDIDDIMTASQHNDDVMAEQGLAHRKLAALAMDHAMGEEAEANGSTLESLEVTVREDTKSKSYEDRAEQTIVVEKPDRGNNGNRAQRRGRR